MVTRGGGSSLAPPKSRGGDEAEGVGSVRTRLGAGEGGSRASRISCERRPPPPAQSQPSASHCGQTEEGEGLAEGT